MMSPIANQKAPAVGLSPVTHDWLSQGSEAQSDHLVLRDIG